MKIETFPIMRIFSLCIFIINIYIFICICIYKSTKYVCVCVISFFFIIKHSREKSKKKYMCIFETKSLFYKKKIKINIINLFR